MEKVYIVLDAGDREIYAVFTSEEAAKRFIREEDFEDIFTVESYDVIE